MESVRCELNPEMFDKAVHGGIDHPVLAEGGDLAVYVKPDATHGGNPMAVITFSVQLPDGSMARAQAATTLRILETMLRIIQGWKKYGHI